MKFNGFFQTATVLGFIILLNSCSLPDFNRHYRQLDDNMIRPFSYRFKNPEIAPGDTAVLDVIFSGKKVKLEDISWKVNWNYITNRFGSSAPVNGFEEALKIIDERIVDTHGGHSQTATIKFVIPDSMLYKSYAVPASLEQMAAMYNFPNIPKIDFPTRKDSILNMFETLAKCPPYFQQAIIDSLGIKGRFIDGLAQIFSAMFEIYIDIPDTPRSKIRHTVRYHGKLSEIYGVFFNRNPDIFDVFFSQGYRYYPIKTVAETASHWDVYDKLNDTIKISLNRNEPASLDFNMYDLDYAISLEKAFSTTAVYMDLEDSYTICFFEGNETYSKLWLSNSPQKTRSLYGEEKREYDTWTGFSKIINIDYDNVKAGDTGYVFLVLFDEWDGVVYRPQGRTTLGFPVKFIE